MESEEEKKKSPVKRERVAGIKEEKSQKEMREKGTGEDDMSFQETKEKEYRKDEEEEGRGEYKKMKRNVVKVKKRIENE